MGVRRRTPLFLLVLCGALAAAWPASGASSARATAPCEQAPCRAKIMVGSTVMNYRSDESFDSTKTYLSVRLFSGQRPLRQASASGTDGCRKTLRGFGLEATVNTCAEVGPVRVTAARLYGGPGWLTIWCRSWPYVDPAWSSGAANSSSTNSSAATGGATAPAN